MHDGPVMEVFQCGHVLHPVDAAGVHGLHLLPGERILLVGVDLDQEKWRVVLVTLKKKSKEDRKTLIMAPEQLPERLFTEELARVSFLFRSWVVYSRAGGQT